MLPFIDRFLNGVTMYHLVLRLLLVLAAISVVFGTFGLISSSGLSLAIGLVILFLSTYVTNELIGKILGVTPNPESAPITALILFFVLAPATSVVAATYLVLAAVVAMASKYVLAIRRQHLFNPAALAAVVVGITTGVATWWVGTLYLLPFVLVTALLITRKVRRFSMVGMTLLGATVVSLIVAVVYQEPLVDTLWNLYISGPIIFFAAIMVTEPFTAPGTSRARLVYGGLIGVVSSLPFSAGIISTTPELTLIAANFVTFFTGLRRRLVLKLLGTDLLARDTYQFTFATPAGVRFTAGQYLEWMLPHAKSDSRGMRRYFTIASAPSETNLRIGVKITEGGSSFKQQLKTMLPGDTMYAAARGGDFILPSNLSEKLVFIAGGIGVTPFRSMIQHIVDTAEQRDAALLYACRTAADIAYKPLFTAAAGHGVHTTYVLSEDPVVQGPDIEHGMIDAAMLTKRVPDFKERTFYLSGPDAMVQAYKRLLESMGVTKSRIRTDYFPGF
jgi:ferredoxin-NADP reductase/Na+-translocating ferredoxin:NAD+ oxidoreductase RnfD subunit